MMMNLPPQMPLWKISMRGVDRRGRVMDKKREEELKKQIRELALHNATISDCVHMVDLGLALWDEAMMECVISLGSANKALFDELVIYKQRYGEIK